jgi:Cdc6-like AAA superfamily ATPase
MPEINIILGPPGTGKTENLLRIVDRELKDGTPPTELLLSALLIKQLMRHEIELRTKFNLN